MKRTSKINLTVVLALVMGILLNLWMPTQVAKAQVTITSLQSYNYPDRFIRHANFEGLITPIVSELDRQDSTFRLVPGLADANHVSFESVNFPNYYLRVEGNRIMLRADDSGQQTRAAATFKKVDGLQDSSWSSFESYSQPGQYIRHYAFKLYIGAPDGSDLFKMDATFKIAAPNASDLCSLTGLTNVTTQEQDDILQLHNAERTAVGVTNNLTWNANLAGYAQRWANYLVASGRFDHLRCPGVSLGENLANNTSIAAGVKSWSDEKQYYHGEVIDDNNYKIFGHYTQMVWRNTTEIGCGVATKSNSNRILVCSYSPAGNIKTQRPY